METLLYLTLYLQKSLRDETQNMQSLETSKRRNLLLTVQTFIITAELIVDTLLFILSLIDQIYLYLYMNLMIAAFIFKTRHNLIKL